MAERRRLAVGWRPFLALLIAGILVDPAFAQNAPRTTSPFKPVAPDALNYPLNRKYPPPRPITNETTSWQLSNDATQSLQRSYPQYKKEFTKEEVERKRLARKKKQQFVRREPVSEAEYTNTHALLYKIALGARNTTIESLLLERKRNVQWTQLITGRALSPEAIYPKKLNEALEGGFEATHFANLYAKYIADLQALAGQRTAGKNVRPSQAEASSLAVAIGASTSEVEDPRFLGVEAKKALLKVIQASMVGWDFDRELYRMQVLEKRKLLQQNCRILYAFDRFAGDWKCNPDRLTLEKSPDFKIAESRIREKAIQTLIVKNMFWADRRFLTIANYKPEWGISDSTTAAVTGAPQVDDNFLSLVRFEANKEDGVYLERSTSKFTKIQAYQLIAYEVLRDLTGRPKISDKTFDRFTGYNAAYLRYLDGLDVETLPLGNLSASTMSSIRRVLLNSLARARSDNEIAIRYLSDLGDRGVIRTLSGDGGPSTYGLEPSDINQVTLKFSELFPSFIESPALWRLLQNRYAVPDLDYRTKAGQPTLREELIKIYQRRQVALSQRASQRESLVLTIGFAVPFLVMIAGGPATSLIASAVGAAVTAMEVQDGYVDTRNHARLAAALFKQLSGNAYGITPGEVEEMQKVEEKQFTDLVVLSLLIGLEFASVPMFKAYMRAHRVENGGKYFVQNADLWDAKARIRLVEGIIERGQVDEPAALQVLSSRLLVKARRLREVLTETLAEMKAQGRSTPQLEELLAKFRTQLSEKSAALKEELEHLGLTPADAADDLIGQVEPQSIGAMPQRAPGLPLDSGHLSPPPVGADPNRIPFFGRHHPEMLSQALEADPQARFAGQFREMAAWLKVQAKEVDETCIPLLETNGGASLPSGVERISKLVNRAAARPTIENIESAEELFQRILHRDMDEEGLLGFLDEAELALRNVARRDPNALTHPWANTAQLRERLQALRHDPIVSPDVIAKADAIRDKYGAPGRRLARWLGQDKTPAGGGPRGTASMGMATRVVKKILNADFKFVKNVDSAIYDWGINHRKVIPRGYFKKVVQGMIANVLATTFADIPFREFKGAMQGKALGEDFLDYLPNVAINFGTSAVGAAVNPYFFMNNLSLMRRAIGSARVTQVSGMLAITATGFISHDIFKDACLNQILRRTWVEPGYNFVISSTRRKWIMEMINAFEVLGTKEGARTATAVVMTNALDTAIVGRLLWVSIGEGVMKAGGACKDIDKSAWNDVYIAYAPTPLAPMISSAAGTKALLDKYGKLSIETGQIIEEIGESNSQFVEDTMPPDPIFEEALRSQPNH